MRNKGFTYIELIIVIALIGLLAAIAFPRVDNTNMHLMTQARALCTDIRSVRFKTMADETMYTIKLEHHQYWVKDGIKIVKKVVLKDDYEFLYTKQEIQFNAKGTPTHGGDTITIRNVKKKKYVEITIMPATGRTVLYEEIKTY